jgi:hypothetical protein
LTLPQPEKTWIFFKVFTLKAGTGKVDANKGNLVEFFS